MIQPSATVSYKDVSFNLWGNLDTDYYGDTTRNEAQFNETDLTLSYDKSFGMVGLGVGYIYYGLDGVDDSQEVYLSLGLDTLLSPSLTVYREVAHYQAWYISLGISHSFELPKDITPAAPASGAPSLVTREPLNVRTGFIFIFSMKASASPTHPSRSA